MNCGLGTVAGNCSYCICGSSYSGQIFSQDGSILLVNVSISPAMSPHNILFTTSSDGRFSLVQVCPTEEYVFHADGYIDERKLGSSLGGSQFLTKTGLFHFFSFIIIINSSTKSVQKKV